MTDTTIKNKNEVFRTKFEDAFTNRIYTSTNQNKNILPYFIGFDDIKTITDDIPIDVNLKYVVFFNFEFVFMLISKRIPAQNITYIANHQDSFNYVKEAGFSDRGMQRILFDLNTYKKYQTPKQWKLYLMKKLGKLNEFIAVGNIPFTMKNENSEKGMLQIGNDFIKLMNKFNKACYILHAKYDSATFKNEIIKNKNLKSIKNHSKQIFGINSNIYTCTVLIDSQYESEFFTYSNNIESKQIQLNKKNKLVLSKNIDDSISIDESKFTLGDLWKNGNKYLNQLTNSGEFKVIKAPGSYKTDDFKWTYDESENTSFGKWKVILPVKGGGRAVKIAGPEYSVCFSIVSLEVESEEIAKSLKKWIEDNNILSYLNSIRTSGTNSKSLLSKIVLPDGLI